jgi:hypothetical protein
MMCSIVVKVLKVYIHVLKLISGYLLKKLISINNNK